MTWLAEMSCRAKAHDHFQQIVASKGQKFLGSAHLAPCSNRRLAAATFGEHGCQIHVVKRPSSETLFAPMTSLRMAEHTWPCDKLSQSAKSRPNGATALFKPTRTAAARSRSETQTCLHQRTNWRLQNYSQSATSTAPPASAAQPQVSSAVRNRGRAIRLQRRRFDRSHTRNGRSR